MRVVSQNNDDCVFSRYKENEEPQRKARVASSWSLIGIPA
jgi:hypothetical protein